MHPPSTPVGPSTPKAKDPKLQEVFQVAYKWSETSQARTISKFRKDVLAREHLSRQDEAQKVATKAGGYAPYAELLRRFDESGKLESENTSKQLSKLDQQFAEDLENLVSVISSHVSIKLQAAQSVEAAHTAAERNSLQKLEDKFAEFQKQASEQQNQIIDAQTQIQTLLGDRNKSVEALDVLDKDFKSLKSDYGVLQAENLELKQQIADLDAMKRTQHDSDRPSNELQSLVARLDDMETKVIACLGKVENLDIETFEEIMETWVDHDYKNRVLANEKTAVALRQELQSFQESAETRFDKSDSLIQETRKALDVIERSQPAEPQPAIQVSGDQVALQTFVEEKLNSLRDVVQQTVAEATDACGDMVDELGQRADRVEAMVKALEQSSRSNDTRIDSLDASLQQIAAEERAGIERLGKRVESLEGTTTKTIELEKRIQNIQQTSASKAAVNSDVTVNSVRAQLDEVKLRVNALEVVARTLDNQWANLESTHMANRIIEQLNPYSQKNEVQLACIEKDVQQLKDQIQSIERGYADSRGSRSDSTNTPVDGKRHSSPGPNPDEILKKRKLLPQYSKQPSVRSSSNKL